jgi:hypothetical protein
LVKDRSRQQTETEQEEKPEEEKDLLELQDEDDNTTVDDNPNNADILEQEGERDIDITKYTSDVDTLAYQKFYSSLADHRTARAAKLSTLPRYRIRINSSGDETNPKWTPKQFEYKEITNKAWENRQRYIAEWQDMERMADAQLLKLGEIQRAQIERRRALAAGIRPNQKQTLTMINASIEEINENIEMIDEFKNNAKSDIVNKKTQAERYGAKIYLGMSEDEFDNCRYPDLWYVLMACDHKQTHGVPKQASPSSKSSTSAAQGIG